MTYEQEFLMHHGILGQKWGIRRFQNSDGSLTSEGKRRYSSTGIRAAIARRQNAKVDASFNRWKEESAKKEDAISKGKMATSARMAYEKDPKNKELRKEYRQANSAYRKSLRGNTAYRKGSIREEVGKDLSRKYLSEAKKVEKQLKTDPNNRELQIKYSKLMSQHDIARAKARRAQDVGAARSRKIASIKRGMTIAVKGAIASGAVTAGLYAANKYLYNGRLDGQLVNAENVLRMANNIQEMLRYIY